MPSHSVILKVCKEENQPPRSICEVPSHTRFIKLVRLHFPSQTNSRQTTVTYTTIASSGHDEKWLGSQKRICRWGKATMGEQFDFQKRSMASHGKKWLPQSLNSWICPPLVVQHIKHEIPNRGNVETTQKRPTEIPSTECQQNHFLAMGKMKITTKTSMKNA